MCVNEYKITDGVPVSVCEFTVYVNVWACMCVGVYVCVCLIEVGARVREHRPRGSGLWTGYRRHLWISVKQNTAKSYAIKDRRFTMYCRSLIPSGGAFTQISHPVARLVGHGLVLVV